MIDLPCKNCNKSIWVHPEMDYAGEWMAGDSCDQFVADTDDFCDYCQTVHSFLDFGKDFSGKRTLVCSERLSDALVQTMPKEHYGELESEELV